jgi:hypothetical protein
MNPPTAAAAAAPELRDIHLPPAPGWWPPAPGWWFLAIAAVALLAWLVVHLYKRHRRRRYRRAVMSDLDRCIGGARGEPEALAAALSRFLRRLSRRNAPSTGTLVGESWLQHLDQCAATKEFSHGIGRVLIEAPYRPIMAYDAAALIALVRRCTRRVLQESGADA